MTIRSLCLFAAMSCGLVLAATSSSHAFVPCGVTLPDDKVGCAKPFVEGVVDHQWVGIIVHFSGGNGGPNELDPITIARGGNGLLTVSLPPIKPEGQYGDRMWAWFDNDKLYVGNAIYLPGEAHCCYTHVAVRQYGFMPNGLIVEHTATLPSNATHAQMYAALKGSPPI
jgi:hypothetical protein